MVGLNLQRVTRGKKFGPETISTGLTRGTSFGTNVNNTSYYAYAIRNFYRRILKNLKSNKILFSVAYTNQKQNLQNSIEFYMLAIFANFQKP